VNSVDFVGKRTQQKSNLCYIQYEEMM